MKKPDDLKAVFGTAARAFTLILAATALLAFTGCKSPEERERNQVLKEYKRIIKEMEQDPNATGEQFRAVLEAMRRGDSPAEAAKAAAAAGGGGGGKQYVVIINDGRVLRVRSEPDTGKDDNIITRLYPGDTVTVLEEGKTDTIEGITAPWFKVRTADGTEGWTFSGFLTVVEAADKAAKEAENPAAAAQKEMEKVSAAGKIAGASFGAFPADYPISKFGGFTVREFYGPDTRFAMRFNQRPCRVVIASSSGTASELSAVLLLKVRNSQDKEVDAIRLEARFRADHVREVSYIRYCKLEDLGSGNSVEREYYSGGDAYSEGEVIGIFKESIGVFWNKEWDPKNAALPEELWGTWFREGAASGREYDSTWIITARRTQVKYSDGRSRVYIINDVEAWENNPNDSSNNAANKAAEYPAGWSFNHTVLEHEDAAEIGKDYWSLFILNASKNAFTQYSDDLKDIWVKQ